MPEKDSAAARAALAPLVANKMRTASKAGQVLSAKKDTSPACKAVPHQQKDDYPCTASQAEQRGNDEVDQTR